MKKTKEQLRADDLGRNITGMYNMLHNVKGVNEAYQVIKEIQIRQEFAVNERRIAYNLKR